MQLLVIDPPLARRVSGSQQLQTLRGHRDFIQRPGIRQGRTGRGRSKRLVRVHRRAGCAHQESIRDCSLHDCRVHARSPRMRQRNSIAASLYSFGAEGDAGAN
jgi:hypothetical protein